jgi:hypothetical protein
MEVGPVWQPNYVDLSDDRVLRFGGECVVCGAHYVTSPEPLVAAIPPGREPDPATAQQIEEQKFELFNDFDAAFKSIAILCYSCGRVACPDCWDQDKQMCGACVVERGMPRSPYHGGPVDGPLADGFLRRAEPGRYAEIGRPDWLKQLLRAQSDPDAARAARLTAPPKQPRPGATTNTPGSQPRPSSQPDTGESLYLRAPMLPPNLDQFEPPPTAKMETSAPPGPTRRDDAFGGPEGEALPSVVECPRCGAANYDFVTQCSECGLQLIQICPSCDKLNPGHGQTCQFCGELLQRPQGWTSVMRPIMPLAPDEARKRMTGRPAPLGSVSAGPQVRRPAEWVDESMNADAPPTRRGGRERKRSTPRAAPVAAPIAVAPHPIVSNPIVTAAHPYESAGPKLQPVMDPVTLGGQPFPRPSRAVDIASVLAALLERLLTIALLLGLFAVVGVIAAAESSEQANHALAVYLHLDIRQQVTHLLTILHLNTPR